MAKLSLTEHNTLWIPAGWRHIVFTELPGEMVRQITCECRAASRCKADNNDVLAERLSMGLAGNVNAEMQELNAELRD
ncbi:hypothetical protein FN846DRAFT_915061 [Sphaerosporella brunnea]|uniref:Uncharacterized protein n=1 Tax=Sphaerosporella brunnea TaxID=1250544 RepID=A0A5J5EC83_9PEZI|nr:hypothetical protein FN846DRAFT_915061 [Sphaerosporella brunnea]